MILQQNWTKLNDLFSQLIHFKELFTIGNYFIQPQVMHISNPANTHKPHWHTHRTLEFSVLLDGNMIYQIENKDVEITAGDAIVIPPKLRHYWRVEHGDALVFGFMLFVSGKDEHGTKNITFLKKQIATFNYHLQGVSELNRIIQLIIETAQTGDSYYDERILCLSREAYIELFKCLVPTEKKENIHRAELNLRGGDAKNIIELINFYLYDNLHRPIRPAEICEYVGMNVNALNRLLKKHGMQSLGQTIINRKLGIASNLLDKSNRQIKDIASSLGFDDVNYFCRLFKKHKGMSPSNYRLKSRPEY